jgi:hypothetical protein
MWQTVSADIQLVNQVRNRMATMDNQKQDPKAMNLLKDTCLQ